MTSNSSKPTNTFFDDSASEDVRMSLPLQGADRYSQNLPIQGVTGQAGDVGLPPARPVTAASSIRSNARLPARPDSPQRILPASDGRSTPTRSRQTTPSTFFVPGAAQTQQSHERVVRSFSPTRDLNFRRSIESSKTVDRNQPHRNSNASIVTVEQYQRPLVDQDAPPVPTSPVHTLDAGSRLGSPTVPSPTPTITLAHQVQKPVQLQTPKIGTPKSPGSLSGSWGKSMRHGLAMDRKTLNGHRRLSSEPSSPSEAVIKQNANKISHEPSNVDRNYEYYNGNTKFFLSGRLLNARQRPLNILTATLALSPALFFFIFSAPYLWHHCSPAIPIFFAYLLWICSSSFFHASFSDPGILPRNLHRFKPTTNNADPLALGPNLQKWVHTRSYAPVADLGADQTSAMELPVKYCEACNIWRPPRTHHCRICDACIETQDHHCVWLNNCVGRRNYRYFFSFVFSGALLSLYLFSATLGALVHFAHHNDMTFGQAIAHDWSLGGTFFLFLYSIFILAYPTSLTGYHVFLMARGETTREFLHSQKFRKQDRHRPFDQHSYLQNIRTVLCRPRPPTYMQFRKVHQSQDQRFANDKRPRIVKTHNKDEIEMTPGVNGDLKRESPIAQTWKSITQRVMPAGSHKDI